MRGVRVREEGWEGQCDACRQWWPLDLEFWLRVGGLRRCRACLNEERRVYLKDLRDRDPEMRARHREASRANQEAKRALSHDAYLEHQRRWFAKNHVRLNAERAERYAIEAELAGRKPRASTRDETPETLAIRAEYRKKWERGEVKVNGSDVHLLRLRKRREYNRAWMARSRAA